MFDERKLICCSRLLAKVIFAGSVFLCTTGNALAALQVTKNIVAPTIQPAADNDFIFYDIDVTNTGGALTNVVIDDVLGADLNNLVFLNAPLGGSQTGPAQFTIPNMAAGQSTTLNIRARVNASRACPIIENSANVSENSGTFTDSDAAPNIEYDFQLTSGTASNVITHITATSFCEFCDTGEVHITITNPTTAPMTNITLVEDLQSLGLTFVNGSTTSSIGGAANPTISGGGTILTWTSAEIGALSSLAAGATVEVAFDVSTYTEASILADPNRNLFATASFDMSCLAATQTVNSGQFELPIRQPIPNNTGKNGRNFDAGQTGYAEPVFGNENDDVIWRVDIDNPGLADMEALRIADVISGNFSINFICPTEFSANATALANGAGAAGCVPYVTPFDVDDPFGNVADPDDVAQSSTNAFIYFVGRILNTHTNEINNADISYGCEATSSGGGLITVPASTGGATPGTDLNGNSDLSTNVVPGNLQITQTVTGSNAGQPLGSKGLVTVVINNQTGGTVTNVELQNVVPNGYVVDGTFGSQVGPNDCDCTVVFDPAYGPPGSTYPGFIDTVVRDDGTRDNGNPLDDVSPHFTFTSSSTGSDANQDDLLRHGDVVTLTFGIVMIDPVRFDVVADLDLAPEVAPVTDPTGTTLADQLSLSSTATVDFDAADTLNGLQNQSENDVLNFNPRPEDLDIAISDALFILTNDPGTPLDLNVLLTNNGGHDADDYTAYITFGQAMTVQTVPGGCAGPVANPPPQPHWDDPAAIPGTAAVYACDRGTIAPGVTETFTFTVVKAAAAAIDDLTFRADVFGEITLFDTSLLTFPAPPTIPDTTPNIAQLANNYSFDAIRSKVLGFNLVKSAWYCAEDGLAEPGVPANILSSAAAAPNSPPLTGNLNSQIGEDCAYRVESGGWFGFVTPGFTLIEVENVTVSDELPDGQGFIPFDTPVTPFNFAQTTANIILVDPTTGGAGTTPLDEADITWRFNTATGINQANEFFRVDFKTRLLNDNVDLDYLLPLAGPNLHSNPSLNVATTSFTAVFQSEPIAGVLQPEIDINVSDTLNDPPGYIVPPGYPVQAVREVQLTDVEPNLIVTKTVCNETLDGAGINCNGGVFANSINDGDTDDSYIYRITLENQTSVPVRSPAFNVISTDTLDASDLMLVVDFASDGLDNDGDTAIDEADEAALFASIPDNNIGSGGPAVITVNESFNALLSQIDPGPANAITFYYRVDPDDAIAPLQMLTNTVSMSFDSLDAAFGNQNVPQLDNTAVAPNDAGRARIYTSIAQTADVQMIPLLAQPKAIIALSNTTLIGGPSPQTENVVVGEEVRYELTTQLPVANLRNFVIRDRLPAGMRCVENGPVVVMGPGGPHAAAGFNPATDVTPVCSAAGDEMVWNFGDRELTMAGGASRFDFVIDFVARVDNAIANQEGLVLTNGGGAGAGGTDVTAEYVNEASTTITLDFASVDVIVREPDIALTKAFAVVNSDAADVLTVTVTATNNGTAAAYNLQILDNLLTSDLTYINDSMAGADAPDDDGVIADSKAPTFSWLAANPDYEILTGAGNAKTFTFQVRVDTTAQPLEILDNTIEGKWDSLPGQTTALNASGSIDADGSVTGLRNGVLPNVGGALNNYETTATASTSVLPLTISKNELSGAIPTIGAHQNFEVVINLPEGTTENVIITDDLNFSGLSYALSRNASFDITYTFNGIATIEGLVPAEGAFRAVTALPVDAQQNLLTWDIGQVVTNEDIAPATVSPSITINYFARANNDVDTDITDTIQNSATLTYANGEDNLITESLNDNTPAETVEEPVVTFDPAIILDPTTIISNLTSPSVLPDAGDVLEYQVTVVNSNAASVSQAFDVNLVSTLAPELVFDGTVPPTALINGVAVPLFNATPNITTVGLQDVLTWGRGNGDNTLDIPASQSLVLTYRVLVQAEAEPNVVMDTVIDVDWTSIDDLDVLNTPFERTGGTCPVIVQPDDYCIGVTASITVIDNNSIAKTVILDTYNEPPLSNDTDSIVRIGDTVTYQLDINIQEGTTRNINILDILPAGMEFVDVVSINGDTDGTDGYDPPVFGPGSNFSYPNISAANVPTVDFDWNLGTIVNNTGSGFDTTTDILVIVYRTRVVDNVAATIAQLPTTTLTNTADFTYLDGNGTPSPADPRLTDSADVIVLQPVMDLLSKTDRSGRLSGDAVNVATDTMNFRLETCNTTGLARAYGLVITDTLATELDNTSLTVPVVTIGGAAANDGVDYVYTPPPPGAAGRGGDMVFTFSAPVDPGDCVNIDFDIGFYTDFGFGAFSNQVLVNEYHSLPPANGQLYGPLGPAIFTMNNPAVAIPPPDKIKLSADEATVGDEVVYQITVPSTPIGASLFNVTITDIMDTSLVFVAATDPVFTLNTSTVLPNELTMVIDQIPAGQQAVIEVRARVDNNVDANAGLSFDNTTRYTYTDTPALPVPPAVPNNGGNVTTADPLTIVEPFVAVTKTVTNTTQVGQPDAGDVLRYTITLTASGGVTPGDLFSDAFDISITDNLSLGLLYNGNPIVDGAGNTIVAPVVNVGGDGIVTPQTLNWSLSDVNADIDIIEGDTVTVTYEVLVLDSVQANQDLTSAVNVQWHSRDGPDVNQRDGSGTPALNDYFVDVDPATSSLTTPDNNTVTKTRVSDTFDATNNVRIGDIIEYRLLLTLQEGTHPNVTIADNLPLGMRFEETVSINGDTTAAFAAANAVPAVPYTHPDIAAPAPAAGPTAITWAVGSIVNPGDNLANDTFEIIYRARVLNLALAQLPNIQPLTNSVDFTYDTAMVPSAQNDTETVTVLQPNLSVSKIRIPVLPLDTVLGAGEVVTYRVDIDNAAGTAPAYDTVLRDIIPLGMRIAGVTTTNVQLIIGGVPQPALPNLVPVYDGATGATTWDFDTATADQYTIPAGEILRIEYQAQADAGIGAGLTLINEAQVQLYYSFDDGAVPSLGVAVPVREIYGPSNIAQVALDTLPASALLKTNPTDLEASIGETFSYRITVPGVMQPTALYDVRILDDLVNDSLADLQFVSVTKVSGSQPWTPANIGTVADNLIIADAAIGIDIPANEQVEIDVTVTLRNADPPNVAGLLFNNTATYTFNQIDNNAATQSNGLAFTTADMTVVEPDLTMDKRGPAGTVNFAVPIPYTLVVENIGTGPAFDTTLVDKLPDVPDNPPLTGGTCDAPPQNFNARITTALDETTVVRALVRDTDYTATHTAAPACQLVITTLTDAARIEAGEKLLVSYETLLDVASQSDALLTNTAGVTRWFSLDTAGAGATGEIREYTSALTDSVTVTVEAPVLNFQKTVFNVTTGLPGSDASPGDTLHYSISVQNIGPVSLPDFSLTDEVDGLAPLSGFFAPGTMANFVIPAGADNSNTDINGGANGAGLLDVRNLSIGAAGDANDTIVIEFDVTLLPVITSGTVILNQAQINSPSTGVLLSDDPLVAGTVDPTPTLITSAPAFLVKKISQDMTGDPAILEAGDTLRYTLTVKNIGLENALDTLLSDQIPANMTYVADTVTLNGLPVGRPDGGVSPLVAGMPINAPEDTTAGFLRADTNAAANNVATITFDVVVSMTAVNGTLISNQGFFNGKGAGSGVFPQQPSDDPGTTLPDDPTIDVVGNVPVVDALKTVAIQNDINSNGIVDPGDTLRYTITTINIGALPATNVVLTDNLDLPVAGQVTYVPSSGLLDGLPLPAGSFAGSILTVTIGDLPAASSSVVIFDVVVNAGIAAGTIISNQGFVASNELPTEPTDADGNDANGDQPTIVVVGNVQQLAITKQVIVIGGGAAEPGKELEYVVRVTNIGGITALTAVIEDNLNLPVAGQVSYVAGSGLLDGLPLPAASVAGSILTATIGDMPVAAVAELRFRVSLDAGLNIGDSVENTAVVRWNVASQSASATVSIDIGGTPGSANINGQVWHDTDFNNIAGDSEALLQDYRVELYRNNSLLANTLTDVNGVFQFTGLPPVLPSDDLYELRYLAPGATATTATLGTTNSAFSNGAQRITGIFAASGTIVQGLNLPKQVNGIVYDSVLRVPVAGVQLTMINQSKSNQPVPAECFSDASHANQVTQADGYYKFDLNFSDSSRCAENDEYVIQIQPPASGYIGTTSVIIPPLEPITGNALDVANCPGNLPADKIPATAEHCENSASDVPAPASVEPRAAETDYNLKFLFDGLPAPQLPPPASLIQETNQIFNNHIPVDSELGAAVAISKVAGKLNVVRSDLVPYTITFNNTLGVPLFDVSIIDNFPAGFKYVAGSARVDGEEIEPQINGLFLTWPGLSVDINESRVIKLLLVVGSGVGEGEYVNTARAINTLTGDDVSGVASATVRVIPDPTFDCTDIIGKVYEDKNLNGYQDQGEGGIPGVQVATARGLRVTTDSHGRFHITCAIVANEVRGSNFIMKLDDRTLPSGYRVTTENPRVQRATRGKMLKFNFGTAIHRVVRLDLADGVFEKASTRLRPQWESRIELLITELQKEGSILRLSYLGENESEDEVEDRLDAIEELISDRWQELDCCYKLTIETEVFWRKGRPSGRKKFE